MCSPCVSPRVPPATDKHLVYSKIAMTWRTFQTRPRSIIVQIPRSTWPSGHCDSLIYRVSLIVHRFLSFPPIYIYIYISFRYLRIFEDSSVIKPFKFIRIEKSYSLIIPWNTLYIKSKMFLYLFRCKDVDRIHRNFDIEL